LAETPEPLQHRKLTVGATGWVEQGGAGGVLIFATEASLLAATEDDGSIAYAEDTDRYFFRKNGAWVARGEFISTDTVTSPGAGSDSERWGDGATAGGSTASAFGKNASAGGVASLAFGNAANAAGAQSVALGDEASAAQSGSIAVGDGANSTRSGGIAFGDASSATGSNQPVAFGPNANASGNLGTCFGGNSLASQQATLAVGQSSIAAAQNGTALGHSSSVTGAWSTAAGDLANCFAQSAVAFGANSRINSSAHGGIAVGRSADVATSAVGGLALGRSADCNHARSGAIGENSQSTATNRYTFGQVSGVVNDRRDVEVSGDFHLSLNSTRGDALQVKSQQTTAAALSGASVNVPAIPAGSFVVGVSIRVDATVTGAAGIDVGIAGDTQRYGTNIAVALGTTSDFTDFANDTPVSVFSAATDVVLTGVGGSFTAGDVTVFVHYMTLQASTS
jgi:hypothetical protein